MNFWNCTRKVKKMNDNAGWIKLFRKIQDWKWYGDPCTKDVFIHLLINANHEPREWNGNLIETGECVVSIRQMAKILNFSEKQVRTAIKHLKETQEVTQRMAQKGARGGAQSWAQEISVFKVCNYGIYQQSKKPKGHSKWHYEGQHNNNIENLKEKESIVDFSDPIEELFDRLWQLYPRKEGKSSVSEKAKKEIYKIGYDKMASAIEKYKRQIAGREMKYVKMGSSFFNTNYVDYLEETPSVPVVEPKVIKQKIYYD